MAAIRKNLLFRGGLRQWAYYIGRIDQYGLMIDDCIAERGVIVEEAIRRLPPKVADERIYRILRAMQLNCERIVLPKDQWVKYEDDVRYLRPLIDEVMKEYEEKQAWDKE